MSFSNKQFCCFPFCVEIQKRIEHDFRVCIFFTTNQFVLNLLMFLLLLNYLLETKSNSCFPLFEKGSRRSIGVTTVSECLRGCSWVPGQGPPSRAPGPIPRGMDGRRSSLCITQGIQGFGVAYPLDPRIPRFGQTCHKP